mmetsp:Transcript_24558/g.47777  ORF Transcript_24558/g.47777 Transcript_24558/m.47777 type:complete len:271 (+) Transcript_24558:397-1209(+)
MPSFEAAVKSSSASSRVRISGTSSVYTKRNAAANARAEMSGNSTSRWPASRNCRLDNIAPKKELLAAKIARSASNLCCSHTKIRSAGTAPLFAAGGAGPPEGPAPGGRRAAHRLPRSACSEPSVPAKHGAVFRRTEITSRGSRLSARGSIHVTRVRRTRAPSTRSLANASSKSPKSLQTPHSSISLRPKRTTKGASRALFSGTQNPPSANFSIVAYAGTRSCGPRYLKKTPGGPPCGWLKHLPSGWQNTCHGSRGPNFGPSRQTPSTRCC